MNYLETIRKYYEARKLHWPLTWEAMGWVATEIGEIYEVLLSQNESWVRNNPEDHPRKTKGDFAEELGDAIMMLLVAGMCEGVDPLKALEEKLKKYVD